MYGAAGAFRTKPYGVEYRVLSNAWLKDSNLMSWVYKNTILGFNALLSGNRVYEDIDSDMLVQITSHKPYLQKVSNWLEAHDRQSTRLNSSQYCTSRMPSSA